VPGIYVSWFDFGRYRNIDSYFNGWFIDHPVLALIALPVIDRSFVNMPACGFYENINRFYTTNIIKNFNFSGGMSGSVRGVRLVSG